MKSSRRARRRQLRVRRRRVLAIVALAVLAAVVAVYITRRPAAIARHAPTGPQAVDPALFSRGACESFPPTADDRHETVFLDAGHGGIDPGAVGQTETGRTIYEADETLPVELDATRYLRAKGFRVVVSRTRASSVVRLAPSDITNGVLSLQGAHDDVAARDICADRVNAAILVGIYFDAGATPANAGSLTAYDRARSFWRSSFSLATLLQTDVLHAMNAHGWAIPDGGVLPDSGLGSSVPTAPGTGGALAADAARYDHLLLLGPAMAGYFSTPSDMPGAVIEPLYITDPFEGSIASSAEGQRVIAEGIAKAVEEFSSSRSDR